MTGPHDREWAELVAAWQASRPALAPDVELLRRRLGAQRQRVALILAAEVLITLLTVGVAIDAVRFHPHAFAITWAAASGVLILIVWVLGVRSGFGAGRPLAHETTAAFLEHSLARRRRQLRTLRLCLGAIVVQLAVLAIMGAARLREEPKVLASVSGVLAWGGYALLGAGYVAWALWFRRRIVRELSWLQRLRDDLLPRL